jgi:hypothetical protein
MPPRAPHRMGNLWRSQQVNKEVMPVTMIHTIH